ncbi:hypothetical protein MKW92_031565, partial [Papaver armeniacum]
MLLGFLSLLLTVGQGPISKICIPKSVVATWHPCNGEEETRLNNSGGDKQHLITPTTMNQKTWW